MRISFRFASESIMNASFTYSAHEPAPSRHRVSLEVAIQKAIRRGYVVGREVLVGKVPGIVVGYNIAGFGHFVGTIYPVVVRTALGIAKCNPDELELF
jgi:hypothetical protein